MTSFLSPHPRRDSPRHSSAIATFTRVRLLLLLLLSLHMALCGSSSGDGGICPTILSSLHAELPSIFALHPPDVSRTASLVRRCAGIAWPLHLEQQQQQQQQQQQRATPSVLRFLPCVHVVFFTPAEAAAASASSAAASAASLITFIMRSRANIFADSSCIARRHVTILG